MAVDLAPGMIEKAHENLKNHLSLNESKLTYEEWLTQNKLKIRVANGEEPLNEGKKFDRIICNHVLMLTLDP